MAKICLSRIESSAFKISSYAGPSVYSIALSTCAHYYTSFTFENFQYNGEIFTPTCIKFAVIVLVHPKMSCQLYSFHSSISTWVYQFARVIMNVFILLRHASIADMLLSGKLFHFKHPLRVF